MTRAILLAALLALAADKAVVGGPEDPTTKRPVQCDLPESQHLKNLPDGGGCCVFASMDMAARWHKIKPLIGVLQDRLGGGYPEKVDKTIARRYPGYKAYVQAEGEASIQLMDWALSTGRPACVTYGYGERYGTNISHMVILLHLDRERACVMDNNFPRTWEWMSRDEFIRRHKLRGGGWSFVFLEPPPPPIPAANTK